MRDLLPVGLRALSLPECEEADDADARRLEEVDHFALVAVEGGQGFLSVKTNVELDFGSDQFFIQA